MAYAIFIDGFDHYTQAEASLKWFSAGGIETANTGRRGSRGCWHGQISGNIVSRAFPKSSHVVLGFAYRSDGYYGFGISIYFRYGGVNQFMVSMTGIGQLTAQRSDAAIDATSDRSMTRDAWHYIEIGAIIADAGGYEIRVDGTAAGWIPWRSLDTLVTAGGGFTDLVIAGSGYVDDLYLTYGDELKWFGDSRVDTLTVLDDAAPMDWQPDSGGAVIDATGKAVTKAGDTVATTTRSKYGDASLFFDGSGDYLAIDGTSAAVFGVADFTIECWAYVAAVNATTDAYLFDIGVRMPALVLTTAGKLQILKGGAVATSADVFPLGQWVHLAMVRESGTIKVYRDGVLELTISYADSLTDTNVSIGTQTANGRANNTYYKTVWYLDEFRITRNLARYTAPFTPPAAAFPTSASGDSDWDKVSLLIKADINDLGGAAAYYLLNQDAGAIQSATPGQEAWFEVQDLPFNPTTIHAIQVNGEALKSDTGTRSVVMMTRSGAAVTEGDELFLATSKLGLRQVFPVDPDTGAAWTKAGVDGLQVGVKVVS